MPEDLIYPNKVLTYEERREGGWEMLEPITVRGPLDGLDEQRIYEILTTMSDRALEEGREWGDEPELALGESHVWVPFIGKDRVIVEVLRREPAVAEAGEHENHQGRLKRFIGKLSSRPQDPGLD